MKVAIIHDWLTGMRGGEKVLEVFCEIFPDATIYTLVYNKGKISPIINQMKIKTSILQKFPNIEKNYRYYLPIMPKLIEQFNLKGYDLIISSSHCVAKGVKKFRNQIHICYCLSPMRYMWDMFDEYFKKAKLITRIGAKIFRPYLRRWDVKSSERVDFFIADSKNIANKIKKYYQKESKVIYPPVNTNFYQILNKKREDFFLIVSALVPYKKISLAIETFNELNLPLKIIGTGPEEKKLREIANKNIEFLGWQPDEKLLEYYNKCRALIFPQEEDFGIVPLEAQACGCPVIAYKKGGALETVIENETGIFFYPQTKEALIKAIKDFENLSFSPERCRENALRFSRERFYKEIKDFINESVRLYFRF
ncbi:MAG: glycosyltransferase [candidate division WOR-3 bacterium]|uniref:Glycosyltransferase family 4 protein n=1 Tax=candidate division WOR-3 bacterium TaxID=2052148 RepID=A0A7C4S151_UNCW3